MLQQGNWSQNLLSRVGGGNKYQILLFLHFSIKWGLIGMIAFSLNVFYITPQFVCSQGQVPPGSTCDQYVCSIDDQQFWYDHLQKPIPSSISLDYGVIMVCSKKWLSSLLQSCRYLGGLFGYLLLTYIADSNGRKKTEFIAWIINITGIVILVISINLWMVGIGSFLMGVGTCAVLTLHLSFTKQLMLGNFRQRAIIGLQMTFSLGVSLVALVSMFIKTWKIVAGCFILIPSVLVVPFGFMLIEQTPKFSLKRGKSILLTSINRIARINNQQQILYQDLQFVPDQNQINKNMEKGYSLLDLFKYSSLISIAIYTALINMTIQFIYDGTILSLDKIGINIYLDQILIGLVEILGAIFCSYIIVKVKRKKFTQISLFCVAMSTLLIGILSLLYEHKDNQINFYTIIQMVILGFLRFVLNSLWGGFFVYVGELFPSDISSISYGWISAMGTAAAIAAPYIRLLTADITYFFVCGLCIFAILLISRLKQTKGLQIKQGIQQRQNEKNSVVSGGSYA